MCDREFNSPALAVLLPLTEAFSASGTGGFALPQPTGCVAMDSWALFLFPWIPGLYSSFHGFLGFISFSVGSWGLFLFPNSRLPCPCLLNHAAKPNKPISSGCLFLPVLAGLLSFLWLPSSSSSSWEVQEEAGEICSSSCSALGPVWLSGMIYSFPFPAASSQIRG